MFPLCFIPSVGRSALALTLAALFTLSGHAGAQRTVQDDVDRNLQERRARQFELQMGLDPGPAPAPAPEAEVRRSLTLPTPGTTLLEPPRPLTPRTPEVVERPSGRLRVPSLVDDQRRRQQGLQTQTRSVPEPARRQALEAQQLQFEREMRAEQLRLEIMRNSERALRR
ncbi:MAG: hypothetical protein KIS79_08810 [Burkholderiales bacterium]|nr:hypothetical protein [Burkholderiales bacterium]